MKTHTFAILAGALAPMLACSTVDTSEVSAAISTSSVISRAEEWVSAELHYCQASYDAPDGDQSCWAFEGPSHRCDRESVAAWNAYRSDCSGFVTWSWGLPPVGDGGYVTGDFAPFDTAFSHVIAAADLQPGDALNKVTNEHIVLFKQWITPGQSAMFLEEPGCSSSEPYAHEFSSSISMSGANVVISFEGSTPFTPIRFDDVQGSTTSVPAVRVVVGANADGRLELFFIDADNAIQHTYQNDPGGHTGWFGPVALGGKAKSLALGTEADGRLDLFYVGTNDDIYHNVQNTPNGGWSGEAALGGKAAQLAVGRDQDDRLELFYVGTNADIYHNYQTQAGTWSGEKALGGKAKQLAVAPNPDGSLEVAYVGTNDHVYENYQKAPNSGWHGEAALGGEAKQVAFGHHPDGRLELFYIGTDDALYHNYQTDLSHDWSGQSGLGGKAKQIATGEDADGRIELFYVGTDDALYHNAQTAANAGWLGQQPLGGKAEQIIIGSNTDGRLELFYIGTNAALYHNWETAPSSTWSGQSPL